MSVKDKLIFALYTAGIRAGNLYISAGSHFSAKLAKLKQGREQTIDLPDMEIASGQVIWMHCSSLGEFEQGRPLIEKLKNNMPGLRVYLSFFSPSGYEIRKDYAFADRIFYLPADLSDLNTKLLNRIRPDAFILVKYDLWWNLLTALIENKVPVYLISGVFRGDEYFFKPAFSAFVNIMKRLSRIFVQDGYSENILVQAGFSNVTRAGDTRVDRVLERASTATLPERIIKYADTKKVIIYGSVWKEDMPMVRKCLEHFVDFVHIIAPHDIDPDHISGLMTGIENKSCLYSAEKWDSDILIIDNIGMLSSLYMVARYVYIGGGFGKGIHNILEPAAYGIPVFFGPKHRKFNEAADLISLGGASQVLKPADLTTIIREMENDDAKYTAACLACSGYITDRSGATKIIAQNLITSLQHS